MGSVLGFIIAGIVLGPNGLGRLAGHIPFLDYIAFTTAERVAPFADLGLLFLLFVIGLELSLERLWAIRGIVFGFGGLQIVLTTAVIAGLAIAFGNSASEAVVLGFALSFASTAIVVPVMIEAGRWTGPVGRTAFAVLLAQDLAVVPIVTLVEILGSNGQGGMAAATVFRELAIAVLAVGIIIFIGRFALKPLLRLAAATGSRELVLAIALFVAIAAGLLTGAAGMSPALGAFLAGLLLSGSEFRHELEIDIDPFKGLLLGLFFMTIGMGLDLGLLGEMGPWLIASLFGLVVIKALVFIGLALAFRFGRGTAVEVGFALAGCGEFAFVVLALGRGRGIITPETLPFMTAVAVLSMMATPSLAFFGRWLGKKAERAAPSRAVQPGAVAEQLSDHVVIGGFGRVGQTVARLLEEHGVPYVAVDVNIGRVEEGRSLGKPVYLGDVSRAEMLAQIGAERANSFVITADEPSKVERTVRAIRDRWPQSRIFARARDEAHAAQLVKLGASDVVPEAVEGSLLLAGSVLEDIGIPEETIEASLDRARAEAHAAGRDRSRI